MHLVGTSYRAKLPWYLIASFVVLFIVSIVIVVFFLTALFGHKLISHLGDYGTQGDFFGGHIAAVTGSLALLVVLFTGYVQTVHEQRFRLREHFLAGIAVIGQYDVAAPGCEQAMRMLDYYSSIALELQDQELFLLLNTVMTKEIRKRLEEIDASKQEIYLDAREARRHVQEMLKQFHKARKAKQQKT